MELFAAFLERWHEGEETINELCAAHAEHAPFLRGCWDQLKTIGEVSDGRAATPSVSPGPHRIGPFEIVEEIGRGGQGVVYLAHDTRLDRRVALKILSGFDATSSALVERFRREAELTARLDHPAICPVYDAGAIDDVPPARQSVGGAERWVLMPDGYDSVSHASILAGDPPTMTNNQLLRVRKQKKGPLEQQRGRI